MGAGCALARPLPASGEITLGRAEDCDVVVDDPKVSRCHLVVRVENGAIAVVDKGSRNGSFLGTRQLPPDEPVPLAIGDVVRFGSTVLMVEPARESAGRPRLHGRASFERHVAMARSRGERVRVLQVVLRVPLGPGAPSTWGEADPSTRELLARFDRILDEVCDDTTVIAETGPVDRRLMIVARDDAWPITADAVAGALRRAGIDAAVDVVAEEPIAAAPVEPRPAVVAAPAAPTGGADPMAKLWAMVDRVAASHINVLILGETGVGKEVMASTIHARSPRARAPLVCLNCAALSEPLLESELFGHEKGAFTGATSDKPGLLEAASGGVVFLDEVGEMPLSMQAKLLRVLEKREVLRVGSLRPRPIDVRFVAATNRDLEAEVRAGRFRQDLYFRLNGVTLVIPPLRERVAEIEPLAVRFADEARRAAGRPPLRFAPETVAALTAYDWPGNIRELKNVIERAVLFCEGDTLSPEHLALPRPPAMTLPELPSTEDDAEDEERRRVLAALEACAGNQTQAARMLGIARGTLIARLEKYNVPRPRKR